MIGLVPALYSLGCVLLLRDLAGLNPRPPGYSWVIWDVIDIAWLLNPAWGPSALVPTPGLDGERRWVGRGEGAAPMREGFAVARDAVFGDFFGALARAPGEVKVRRGDDGLIDCCQCADYRSRYGAHRCNLGPEGSFARTASRESAATVDRSASVSAQLAVCPRARMHGRPCRVLALSSRSAIPARSGSRLPAKEWRHQF